MRNKQLLAIDLFAGAGGLTQGLKEAGMTVIGAVENDPIALESYQINHPGTAVWDSDIRSLDPNSIKRALGLRRRQLDLLAGCPPCEGFSRLRTLNGSKTVVDERNDLIYDFLRFVEALLPKTIMLENVPQLVKDERFTKFVSRLEELGYKVEAKVLDVARYGVAQRRARTILLATRKRSIAWAPPTADVCTVRRAIGHLPPAGKSGDMLHDCPERRKERTLQLIRSVPKNGGSRRNADSAYLLRCHQNFDGFSDVYGRMWWDKVSPTITSGCFNPSKGRFLHPEADRAITLREAALLQSFPAEYHISLSRGKEKAADIIGNAIPPEFVKRHALGIVDSLRANRARPNQQ